MDGIDLTAFFIYIGENMIGLDVDLNGISCYLFYYRWGHRFILFCEAYYRWGPFFYWILLFYFKELTYHGMTT